MSNSYFRFRQFIVEQQNTAMKVCTDACLFGAWIASEIYDEQLDTMLDIGTGTGLLSLMVAQAAAVKKIDAVEIDRDAFEQARDNFRSSPWSNRLQAFHTSVQHFDPPYLYDFIVSNPPFYKRNLRSPDDKQNMALHDASLGFEELIFAISRMLRPHGKVAVLIPFSRSKYFELSIRDAGLSILKKVNVKQTPEHDVFRCMYILEDSIEENLSEKEIVIRTSTKNETAVSLNQYTNEFNTLLKDYYL